MITLTELPTALSVAGLTKRNRAPEMSRTKIITNISSFDGYHNNQNMKSHIKYAGHFPTRQIIQEL